MTTSNLINLTKKLVKIPSVKNNLEARKKIVNFVINQFQKEKVYIKKFSFKKNPSLVITLKKEKNPFLFLVGHLDVVEAEKKDFIPRIKNNRIYGRGTGDMKGAIAVIIEVLKHFSKQEQKPSLGLILTTDEEVGGTNGIGYLINKKRIKPKLVFFPDGGGNLTNIVVKEKGVLHLKIKTFGKTSHAARPWLGENAIDRLIKVYSEIRKFIPQAEKPKWKSTLSLGKITGGKIINEVPDSAEMFLDIRYIKKGEREKILEKIRNIINRKDKVKVIAEGMFFCQDKNHPFLSEYLKIAEKELRKITFKNYESSSDARFFSEKGIPTIITQIKQGNIHSENEWVDIKEMEKLYNILIKLINTLDI